MPALEVVVPQQSIGRQPSSHRKGKLSGPKAASASEHLPKPIDNPAARKRKHAKDADKTHGGGAGAMPPSPALSSTTTVSHASSTAAAATSSSAASPAAASLNLAGGAAASRKTGKGKGSSYDVASIASIGQFTGLDGDYLQSNDNDAYHDHGDARRWAGDDDFDHLGHQNEPPQDEWRPVPSKRKGGGGGVAPGAVASEIFTQAASQPAPTVAQQRPANAPSAAPSKRQAPAPISKSVPQQQPRQPPSGKAQSSSRPKATTAPWARTGQQQQRQQQPARPQPPPLPSYWLVFDPRVRAVVHHSTAAHPPAATAAVQSDARKPAAAAVTAAGLPPWSCSMEVPD